MKRHGRILATVAALVGLVAVSATIDQTSASWNDEAVFSAQVSSGNWTSTTTTTTTTPPPPPPLPGDPSGGISSGNPDTVVSAIVWSLNGSRQFCTEVRITGASATARPWAINVDLTQPPFYGMPTYAVQTNNTGQIAVVNSHTLRITGNGPYGWQWDPRQNNTPITNTQTALLTLCAYNAPVPPPAPANNYAVTYANGTWTSTQACVVATITTTRHDLAEYPFYYGWSIPLDLTAAKARITSVGNTLNDMSWSPYPNGDTDGRATPATYNPPQDTYTFTSGFNNSLRATGGGADSRTVTACVNGYSTGNNGNGKGKNPNVNIAATPTEASTGAESTTTVASTTTTTTVAPGITTTTTGTLVPPPAATTSTVPGSTTPSTTVTPTTVPPTTVPPTDPPTTSAPTTAVASTEPATTAPSAGAPQSATP